MLNFFLALCLAWFPAQAAQKPADPEQVREALVELKAAFRSQKSADQISQIQKHQLVMDVQVAEAISKGLKDKDMAVRRTAIEALRWMHFPPVLKALHRTLQRDKRIKKDDEVLVALIQAIGQHGDPSSIKLLADGLFSSPSKENVQARLYSLGHIRHGDSLKALMNLLQRNAGLQTQGKGKATLQAQYDVALEAITGQVLQGDPQLWHQWWRKNKKTFRVPKQAPALSPKSAKKWATYWSKPLERREREQAQRKRKDSK